MQKRLPELDALRALSLLGVIVIHATAWSIPAGAPAFSSALALVSDFARASVPLFVLASGFALRSRHSDGGSPAPGFLRRRWRRTLVPWLCWVPIFATVGYLDGAIDPSASGFGSWLAYGAGHLYFLLLIAQLYIVFLLLPSSTRRLVPIAAAALALQLALGWAHTYLQRPPGLLGWPFGVIAFWQAPYYAGYFLAGAVLADLWPRLHRSQLFRPAALGLLVLGAVLWAWTSATVPSDPAVHGASAFLWPGRAPLVLGLAATVLAWGPGAGLAASRWLGSRSLGVYLAHPAFLAVAGPPALSLGPAARCIALGAGSLAFGFVVVSVLARTRLGAQAIGEEIKLRPASRDRRLVRLSVR